MNFEGKLTIKCFAENVIIEDGMGSFCAFMLLDYMYVPRSLIMNHDGKLSAPVDQLPMVELGEVEEEQVFEPRCLT